MHFDRDTTVEEVYARLGEWSVSCLPDEYEELDEGFCDGNIDIG